MINLINAQYFFQTDENAVPVFYINKATWTEEYKRIISLCAYNRKCYLIIEPDPQVCNRYCEITCMCLIDFEKNYELINHLLGLDIKNN